MKQKYIKFMQRTNLVATFLRSRRAIGALFATLQRSRCSIERSYLLPFGEPAVQSGCYLLRFSDPGT